MTYHAPAPAPDGQSLAELQVSIHWLEDELSKLSPGTPRHTGLSKALAAQRREFQRKSDAVRSSREAQSVKLETERIAAQDALTERAVLAAEASARWAKWSMVIAGLAFAVAVIALAKSF